MFEKLIIIVGIKMINYNIYDLLQNIILSKLLYFD